MSCQRTAMCKSCGFFCQLIERKEVLFGETKLCKKCNKRKLKREFYKRTAAKDGLQFACIPCKRKADRKYNEGYLKRPLTKLKRKLYNRTPSQINYYKQWQKMRDKHIQVATPPWANLDAIAEIYMQADRLTLETGIVHEVHHIFPLLQFKDLFMGLHCENNLVIMSREKHVAVHKALRQKYEKK